MDVAINLQRSTVDYIRGMDAYIEALRNVPKEEAQKDARRVLFETGVTTETGEIKKEIVSWE